MVYYGIVSRGCERCRQRKVKCDQRTPGCSRCERSKAQCPGYRNLNEVIFRDESTRVIRKARRSEFSRSTAYTTPEKEESTPESQSLLATPPIYVPAPLTQSINEVGAGFFFTKYTFHEHPFYADYCNWLTQAYLDNNNVLSAVIEAVGMGAMSNILCAPEIAAKSEERYCKALVAMKQALNDPNEAAADTTLMAAILLGFFETVNFETRDRYGYWAAHVKGAMTLLELRGQEQFTRPRGGLLYVLTRSQILLACMQQHMPVPPALVRATFEFQGSDLRQQWKRRNVASPGSICEISFRIVNLAAAFKSGEISDPNVIRKLALGIDSDLTAWASSLASSWQYRTIESPDATVGYGGKYHVYPNLWVAEAWNNWRTLRLLINKTILQNELNLDACDETQQASSFAIIQQLSAEICISTSSFTDSSRVLSLIRPLYCVSTTKGSPYSLRCFAVEQLRSIGAAMGIRQAGFLADSVLTSLNDLPSGCLDLSDLFATPLIPFF